MENSKFFDCKIFTPITKIIKLEDYDKIQNVLEIKDLIVMDDSYHFRTKALADFQTQKDINDYIDNKLIEYITDGNNYFHRSFFNDFSVDSLKLNSPNKELLKKFMITKLFDKDNLYQYNDLDYNITNLSQNLKRLVSEILELNIFYNNFKCIIYKPDNFEYFTNLLQGFGYLESQLRVYLKNNHINKATSYNELYNKVDSKNSSILKETMEDYDAYINVTNELFRVIYMFDYICDCVRFKLNNILTDFNQKINKQ